MIVSLYCLYIIIFVIISSFNEFDLDSTGGYYCADYEKYALLIIILRMRANDESIFRTRVLFLERHEV